MSHTNESSEEVSADTRDFTSGNSPEPFAEIQGSPEPFAEIQGSPESVLCPGSSSDDSIEFYNAPTPPEENSVAESRFVDFHLLWARKSEELKKFLHVIKKDDTDTLFLLCRDNIDNASMHIDDPIDIGGGSLLFKACKENSIDCAKFLLEKGAVPHTKTFDGELTPFLIACLHGHTAIVELLLGFFPEARSVFFEERLKDGKSALNLAIHSGRTDMVELLIGHGAPFCAERLPSTENVILRNPTALQLLKDYENGKPFERLPDLVLTSEQHIGSFEALGEKFREDKFELMSCITMSDKTPNLESLGPLGVDAAMNRSGRTLLHYACKNGRVACAKILLEKGAKISKLDDRGCTPLHYASSNGHEELLGFLLSKTDSEILELGDKTGKTALHFAAEKDKAKAVELLILAGASTIVRDNEGKTPLEYAFEPETKEKLKAAGSGGASSLGTTNIDGSSL